MALLHIYCLFTNHLTDMQARVVPQARPPLVLEGRLQSLWAAISIVLILHIGPRKKCENEETNLYKCWYMNLTLTFSVSISSLFSAATSKGSLGSTKQSNDWLQT